MYEIAKKFLIHYENVKPFLAKLNVQYEIDELGPVEHKTFYLNEKPLIKVRSYKSQSGELKLKSRYSIVKHTPHFVKLLGGKEKLVPFIVEEEVTRFVADSFIKSQSRTVPVIYKLRRSFHKKNRKTDSATADLSQFIVINFDEVQGVGRDSLFVEFTVMVDSLDLRLPAIKAINSQIDIFKPFVGEFPADSYLHLFKEVNRSL